MEDFKVWKYNNRLIVIVAKSASFTWYNVRSGSAYVERKLDKSLCNNSWLDVCQTMVSTILPRLRSDHHPILVESSFSFLRLACRFKFIEIWTLHDTCRGFIIDYWKNSVVGCPMFVLSKKLPNLKNNLN